VLNKCGETNLRQLAEELGSCSKVIGNDSGGMHLSNAVGTPSVVLFGPTNPTVTSPCFNAPLEILQAPTIEDEGLVIQEISNLSVSRVFRGVQDLV
jgi:heptosyltransferase-2